MRKLKQIKQLDKYGCTIACLSMITKIPYFETRTILHEKIDRLKKASPLYKDIGLNCRELQEALINIFNIQCKFIKFSSLRKLKNHCILYICPLEGGYDYVHAVVFDVMKRRILDPSCRLKNLNEHNVLCCIEIQ